MEEKSLDKLEFNKSIKVCSFKDNPKKIKRQATNGKKFVFKDLYAEYIENSYSQ